MHPRHTALRTLVFSAMVGLIAAVTGHAQAPTLKGSFVINKTDAKLTHVRAVKTTLDDGTKKIQGYAVLLSAKPAEGDFAPWRTSDAKAKGSFIYLLLEPTGAVWVAELAHAAARSGGRFGVVTEVKKVAFAVKDGRISGQYSTNGEQTFTDDRFTIDVTFDAPLEGK